MRPAKGSALSDPLPRRFEHFEGASLGSPLVGHRVVLPGYQRRGRDHDALHAAAVQPEAHPAVVEQVELEVPPPAQALPAPLCFPVVFPPAARHDLLPGGQDPVPHVAHKGARVKAHVLGREVVEEDPPHPAVLPPCGDVEVVVAPRLVPRVECRIVLVAHAFPEPVELPSVLLLQVGRGEVAPSPVPHRPAHLKQAHVGSEGGDPGASGVEHQRHGGSRVLLPALDIHVPTPPGAHGLGPLGCERPAHDRHVGCCLHRPRTISPPAGSQHLQAHPTRVETPIQGCTGPCT
mmetsp:Transcript_35984/g.113831  ORF Transcript_35984/g.113831 Transcript_35984/m.113831 type:complete len:291 (+) Transcript_35984:881-1753(+)